MSVEITPLDRQVLSNSTEMRKWFKVNTATQSALKLGLLPDFILPEYFYKAPYHPVELMLVALMEGAWVSTRDWQVYGRLTIAARLRKKKVSLFHGLFAEMQEPVLKYQMYGGTLQEQKTIQKFAKHVLTMRLPELYAQACARLCLSITDPIQENSCIYPLHWIRAVLATQDSQPVFGMAAYQVEMAYQKRTLCNIIHTELPESAF